MLFATPQVSLPELRISAVDNVIEFSTVRSFKRQSPTVFRNLDRLTPLSRNFPYLHFARTMQLMIDPIPITQTK